MKETLIFRTTSPHSSSVLYCQEALVNTAPVAALAESKMLRLARAFLKAPEGVSVLPTGAGGS
ncbi:hypothetical protein BaRGS_00015171, partial [Batillaria attramentaria]